MPVEDRLRDPGFRSDDIHGGCRPIAADHAVGRFEQLVTPFGPTGLRGRVVCATF
jgi:hypothetical protein